MGHHIEQIYLEGEHFERYSVVDSPSWLSPLSKINIFVGANNTGKSRFLRYLASIKKLRFRHPQDPTPLLQIVSDLEKGLNNVCADYNCIEISGLRAKLQNLPPVSDLQESDGVIHELKGIATHLSTSQEFTIVPRSGLITRSGIRDPRLVDPLRTLGNTALERITEATAELQPQYDFKRVYIPTLRGLRTFSGLDDPYAKRTLSDYFPDSKNVQIFTGLTLYQDLRKLLLGNLDERETVANFQHFLSEAFFEGEAVALIPRHDADVIDVKIGEEMQRPIFQLGDGLQSLIILTFPVFLYKDANLLLFLEEPELFLHPGMQRHLLNVLLQSEFSNAQYFIATHSNHLLDLTLDIDQMSVFTFNKTLAHGQTREKHAHVTVENVSNEDHRTLQLLGVQNSAVFLSNCTIWVEGITDRRYLQHFLKLYWVFRSSQHEGFSSEQFKEDLHYSFVEYAGSNITHWSFLNEISDAIVVERLCGRLFLVTDQDAAKGAKKERHQKLEGRLNDRYYCLRCREIENLVSPKVLLKVVSSYEGTEIVDPRLSHSSYSTRLLGQFIEDVLLKGNKQRTGAYRSESGTVTAKTDFCHRALEFTTDWVDLTPEAQKLTLKLHSFIAFHNTKSCK